MFEFHHTVSGRACTLPLAHRYRGKQIRTGSSLHRGARSAIEPPAYRLCTALTVGSSQSGLSIYTIAQRTITSRRLLSPPCSLLPLSKLSVQLCVCVGRGVKLAPYTRGYVFDQKKTDAPRLKKRETKDKKKFVLWSASTTVCVRACVCRRF